jgi:hypothetical protein
MDEAKQSDYQKIVGFLEMMFLSRKSERWLSLSLKTILGHHWLIALINLPMTSWMKETSPDKSLGKNFDEIHA